MAGKKGPLRIAIEDFIETFKFSDILYGGIENIFSKLENEALKVYENLINQLDVSDYLPENMKPSAIRSAWVQAPVQLFPILMMIGGVALGFTIGIISPLQKIGSYKVDKVLRSSRLDPGSGFQTARRYPSVREEIIEGLKELGFTDNLIAGLEETTRPTLTRDELAILWKKQAITDDYFFDELYKQGYTPERIEQVRQLRNLIPGISDIIRMAVREAFSPDVVARFGYDQDYPGDAAEWVTKQGYDEDWFKRSWYAHWNLPSPTQGFEMLHRLRPDRTDTPFTKDDLDTLLRVADIAPYFRERLTQIAYQPITRVDIRRLYATGVYSEQDVYDAYLDIGYNERDATSLTAYTTLDTKQELKQASLSQIIGAYRRGILSRDDTKAMLDEIGYPDDVIEFYLKNTDFDIAQDIYDIKLEVAHQLFINSAIDEVGVMGIIGSLNIPSDRLQAILELWGVQRNNKFALPSRSELDDLYRRGIVDVDDYTGYLKRDGYQPTEVGLFVQRINAIVDEDTRILAEETQKEQERLRTSTLATDYQKDNANINVQIAELRTTIANINVSLYNMTDTTSIDAAKKRILEIKAYIAQLQQSKAEFKSDYEQARS